MVYRRWLITLLACALIFAGLAAYKTQQIKGFIAFAESFPEPSETVEATRVKRQLSSSLITTLGEVVAPQSLELRTQLEGTIQTVGFTSGSLVKQGDLLLQLDVTEEKAQLKAAKARLQLAKLDLQRVRKLSKNGTISAERLDQAVAQFDITKADIAALQATISKQTLRAPFDAFTGLHQLGVGEFLQANRLITTLIGTTDYFWIDFNLPLAEAGTEIGTEVTINSVTHAGIQQTGTIIAKDSVVSANSRNLRFRARISSNEKLPQHAVVNVIIPTLQTREVLTIPATAVRKDSLGDFVFRLIADSQQEGAYRAQRQTITVSRFMAPVHSQQAGSQQDSSQVAVLQGLQQGELIAANGSFKLREQLLVYVAGRTGLNSPASQRSTR